MARPTRSPKLEDLGHAIRVQRTRRRLTQARVAVRAEMHRNQFGAIERGENNPTYLTIMRIADALDVSASHLIGEATQTESEASRY